jgi:hypothetical protein
MHRGIETIQTSMMGALAKHLNTEFAANKVTVALLFPLY